MQRANKGIGKRVERGLKNGALFLQRQSTKVVPIDKNVLRPSVNTRNVGGEGFKTDMVVSYTTEYAVYVHEDLNAQHKEGKQAKFLEGPARDNKKEIFQIIGKG
jgi:hypothetical protein